MKPSAARETATNLMQTARLDGVFLMLLWPLLTAPFSSSAFGAPGDVDPGVNPDVRPLIGVSSWYTPGVHSTAIQTDGKIVIGGDFISVGGVGRNNLARLSTDGTLDTSLNPDIYLTVLSTAPQ